MAPPTRRPEHSHLIGWQLTFLGRLQEGVARRRMQVEGVVGRLQEGVARRRVPVEGVVWGVPSHHTLQRGDVTPPGEGGGPDDTLETATMYEPD